LGSILFIQYTAEERDLSPHLYADIQIYGTCSPSKVDSFPARVTGCVGAVADWTRCDCLQLNSEKSLNLVFLHPYRAVNLDFQVAGPTKDFLHVTLSSYVCDLGFFDESDQ
jgi:hypothetical protein